MPKPPLFTNKLWCLPRYPHELIVHYKWEERAQWLNARAVMSGTSSVHPGSAAAWANNACLTELSWEHRIIRVKHVNQFLALNSQFTLTVITVVKKVMVVTIQEPKPCFGM